MPPRYQYKTRSTADWDKRSKQSASKYASFALDEFKLYVVRKGENWIRILPPTWEDARHFGFDIWVHYGVGPDNGTVLCLYKMTNQKCSICETYSKAEASGREDADQLKPTRRVLAWVLDRKEEEKGPTLWAMPWTVDRDISKICRDRLTGELYQIDHPEAGFDVSFEKEGEQRNTKYFGYQLARRASEVDQKHLDYVIQNPAPSTLLWRTYDEVKALFEGEPTSTEAEQAAAKVAESTPQPQVIKPRQVTEAVCEKTFVFRGERLGCGLVQGHDGECNYERTLAPEPPKEDTKTTQPPAGLFAPRSESQPEPTVATSAPSSKAAALRSRFTTGGRA